MNDGEIIMRLLISGHGEMNTCVTQGVPFTITGARTGDLVRMAFSSQMRGLNQTNTYKVAFTPRGNYLFLDVMSTAGCDEPCGRLFTEAMHKKWEAPRRAPPPPRAPQPGHSEGAH